VPFFWSLIFILFPFFAQAGGFFVGNGGDLIRVNNKYCLVDLFIDGNCRRPGIGKDIDPDLAQFAKSRIGSVQLLKLPSSLIFRKATDLEKSASGLGVLILEAISQYQWQLVGGDFKAETGSSQKTDMERGEIISVAVRRGHRVYLREAYWNLLNAEQKIALVIHEMISAIMLPEPVPNSHKKQLDVDLEKNRKLVARLFESTEESRRLRQEEMSWINFSFEGVGSLLKARWGRYDYTRSIVIGRFESLTPPELFRFAHSACKRAFSEPLIQEEGLLFVLNHLSPARLKIESICTPRGPQLQLSKGPPVRGVGQWSFKDSISCEQTLRIYLVNIFSENPLPEFVPGLQCEF